MIATRTHNASKWAPGPTPHNLPAQLSSFIGRERERAELGVLLKQTRLLTLTGAGGIGKTRLALSVAADLLDAFEDGAWLVELAQLADPALVPHALAGALHVLEHPHTPLPETLANYMATRHMLVIVDNCEHLVHACADLVDYMLGGTTELTIVVTSREPLRIAGETVWRVPALAVPDVLHTRSTQRLVDCDAVRLFVERARAIRADFQINTRNAPAIAQVCCRLDGIPLAIELAAARVNVLSPEQIADRLDDCLPLLGAGRRNAPLRHRTLRSTLEWSHELLAQSERVLFRRLAVMAGWTVEAAETVCEGEGVERDAVLDLLAGLLDKSLVMAAERGGTLRYRLLDTMRQFALERLDAAGEESRVRRQHFNFFLTMALDARQGVEPKHTWLDKVESEHDNVRSALRWSADCDHGAGLQLAAAIWPFWHARGHLSEGIGWLEMFLGSVETGGRDPATVAEALSGAGALASTRGSHQHATALHEQALELRRKLRDAAGIADSLNSLAVVADWSHEYERAEALISESLGISRSMGDKQRIARGLGVLGRLAFEQGDFDRATALLDESLALRRESGDKLAIAMTLTELGIASYRRGENDRAVALLQESLMEHEQLGFREGAGRALYGLGSVARRLGDRSRAEAFFVQSLRVFHEAEMTLWVAGCLEQLAWLADKEGHSRRAVCLLTAADQLWATVDLYRSTAARMDHDLMWKRLSAKLGHGEFEAASAEGRTMTLDHIIEYAAANGLRSSAGSELMAGMATNPLTAREREVAMLIARGLSNRGIADTLVVASSTVERHVANILRKLALHSRTEVAVWAVQHHLSSAASEILDENNRHPAGAVFRPR